MPPKDSVTCIIENSTRRIISKKNIEKIIREVAGEAETKRTKNTQKNRFVYVYIVGVARIVRLNEKFRGVQKPTDVLSFGEIDVPPIGIMAGEVVLCPEIIERQAKKNRVAFRDEWAHVLVHGMLHVLGNHHEESARKELLVQKKENDICKKLRYRLPHPAL